MAITFQIYLIYIIPQINFIEEGITGKIRSEIGR